MPKFTRFSLFSTLMLVFVFSSVGVNIQRTAADGGTIRSNAGFNSNTLFANDDQSTGLVNIGFPINFYGLNVSQLYVNTNGNVTFDSPLGTYTPFDITSTGRRMIAAFFADVDTRAGNLVTYGQDTVDGHPAFGVNYINVGYFNRRTDKLNSFQIVLIDRSDLGAGNFDFEFNYDSILWETGDVSGGVNGLGGFSARVGFSNGTGAPGTFFELAGSATPGALLNGGSHALVSNGINYEDPVVISRYRFGVRGGSVISLPAQASGVCGAGPTSSSVVGSLLGRTQAYYAPGNVSPDLFVEMGTYWVVGVDDTASFYKIILACEYLWVPIESMGPNYDAVWGGRPLPTTVVSK